MAFINGKEILFSTVIGSGGNAVTIELTKEGGVTTLSITDASGTQTATINDGVSIASVEQTATSTEDGGENTLTITLSNGTKTDFIVRNGSKGKKGDTPTKGTDYFTEKEKAEIVNEVVSLVPSYDVATEKIYLDYSAAYLKLTIDNLLDGDYASFQPFDLVCVGSDGMPMSSICTVFVEQNDQVRMLVYDSKHQTYIMYPQYYSSEDGNIYLYFSTNGEYLQVFIRGLVEKCTGATLEIIDALPDGVLDIDIERHAIAGESSGGANIDVTAEVGQTIIVKEVDENGKPTKWESADYQPKTHGIEFAELLPSTTATYMEDGVFVTECNFAFEDGLNYVINWNGTSHTCVGIDTGEGIGVGNVAAVTGTGDTGEPFFVGAGDGMLLIVPLDGSTEIVIGVSGETYRTIDKKYLPSDTMYGMPMYTGGVFRFETWCVQQADETSIFGATNGWVNTSITKAQYEELEEVFKNHLIYIASMNGCTIVYQTASEEAEWYLSFTRIYYNNRNLNQETIKEYFRWSDENECMQRNCVVETTVI